MVIVKIRGGLGNQMFQYAFGKALEQKGYEVKIDISAFNTYKLHSYELDKYNISLNESQIEENNKYYSNTVLTKFLRKIGIETSKAIREKSLLFDKDFLNIEDNNYIEGYFQNEKYFKNIRHTLLEQFTIKKELSRYAREMENKIVSGNNSCSIHIRRGDFVNANNINIHGSCNLEYYKVAVDYIEKKIENASYFIFSDDIQWCKKNLVIKNATYIDSKEKRTPHEDIYLMSICNHNIIANSSFSWWGAWLNQNKGKIIIAPKRWFADDKMQEQSGDIVCDGWIRV